MTQPAEPIGLSPEACTECECEAGSYHYPGCSGAPYVCPGCHAVGGRCAPGCIDAEIERALADSADDFEADDLNGTDDWEWEP